MSCAVWDGTIYTFGNYNIASDNNGVLAFNPSTDVWTSLANMPTGRGMASAAAVNGKIYVFGGNDAYWNRWLTTVEVYDTRTNSWNTNIPAIPGTGRGYLSANAVNGKIYVMGGTNSYVVPTFSDNFVYDPVANSWYSAAPLPRPRSHHGSVVLDGKIYLIGGAYRYSAHQEVFPAEVDVYDPATDSWTQVAPQGNRT